MCARCPASRGTSGKPKEACSAHTDLAHSSTKKEPATRAGLETRNRGIPLETLYNHTEAVCTFGWHRTIAGTGENQRRQTAFVWRLENAPKLKSTHAQLFTGMGRYCRPCSVRGGKADLFCGPANGPLLSGFRRRCFKDHDQILPHVFLMGPVLA